jgi:hypothetical protein
VSHLLVDVGQLFVGRLQFFLGGFQFLVRALQLFVQILTAHRVAVVADLAVALEKVCKRFSGFVAGFVVI